MKLAFPFSAIVGQDEMKTAILIAAIEPAIGGVLVFGDRGTGKSTAVRALAALLPPMEGVAGCRYNCDPDAAADACADGCTLKQGPRPPKHQKVPVPVVDLPLGATEDRVVGALDLERALSHGEKAFEPGLPAGAHRLDDGQEHDAEAEEHTEHRPDGGVLGEPRVARDPLDQQQPEPRRRGRTEKQPQETPPVTTEAHHQDEGEPDARQCRVGDRIRHECPLAQEEKGARRSGGEAEQAGADGDQCRVVAGLQQQGVDEGTHRAPPATASSSRWVAVSRPP